MKKVLLVEDDSAVAVAIGRAFKAFMPTDYELINAVSVKDAERLFDTHSNEITGVICDGNLPDGTGFGVVDYIRNVKGFTGPIVAASSNSRMSADMVKKFGASVASNELKSDAISLLAGLLGVSIK